MAFNKVVWVDREVPYPDRREIHHENGTVETVDIKRAEGEPRKDGTQLNAANFNDLETRIAGGFTDATDAIDNLSSTVNDLSSTVTNISGDVTELSTAVAGKQDALTPGTGISIVNNVISISLIDADTQEY